MSGRPLRIVHASDVHIGGNYHRPQHGEHGDLCLCPLLAVIGAVDQVRPDVLLIAGDLFDHARLGPTEVGRTLDLLADLALPTVLINGNHDVHDDTSPYGRHEDVVRDSGVHFLGTHDGDHVTLFEGDLHVWGRAMPEHTPSYRPLHGVPSRPERGWFVVAGHGHHVGDEEPGPMSRSSPITAADIAATAADYVALGHWHVPTDVSACGVPAWYCGSPLDIGRTGHVMVVDLVPGTGASTTSLSVTAPPQGCDGVGRRH